MLRVYLTLERESEFFWPTGDSPQVGTAGHGAHQEASLALHNLLGAQAGQRWVMDPCNQEAEQHKLYGSLETREEVTVFIFLIFLFGPFFGQLKHAARE